MYRVPDFFKEAEIIKAVWDAAVASGTYIAKPGRLIKVLAPQTTPPPTMINGWMPFEFPYPSVLFPTTPLRAGTAETGKLFAHTVERPDDPPNGGTFAIPSFGGKLWIQQPGKYYLVYDGPLDSSVECVVYDDTCAAAQQTLKRYVHHLREPAEVSVLAAAATNIFPGDSYRDGIMIQNQGTVDIWVRKGTAAEAPAAVGTGLIVPARQPLSLPEYTGPLNGRADGANCDVFRWEFMS